ncbi:HNH endonuclease [Tepidibacter aestuarii]|uniref:HNH endonuclease n=1 Tax=Tepidibacter aestuarii TaxID=2925782 RepID=UPI0020BD8F3F|nr:HNH endonuclease [Tepidibacter aestuarii]CAH2213877.1 conserved protein of unknown function [Tepidibacter aestuarii]
MNIDEKVKTWYSTMTFDNKHCFLCGLPLDENNGTSEHVFPKWLQRKHNLWNQFLTLPNNSKIQYRQLVVPCCKKCNNEYLSEIENQIKNAFNLGLEEVRNLDSRIIYKWIMKIFYCLMYKDLSLQIDRGSKEKGNILTPEMLSKYRFMFDCMQSIRMSVEIDERYSSLFIFDIHKDIRKDASLDFFYVDDILHSQIVIQSDNVGIICCIGDNKVIEERLKKYFEPFYEMKLHPVQFRQLITDVFYHRLLLKNSSNSIMMPNEIILMPSFFNSFDEYNVKEYAKCLFYLLHSFGFEFEDIYDSQLDAALNLLVDKNKRIIKYDENNLVQFGDIHEGYIVESAKDVRICASPFPK